MKKQAERKHKRKHTLVLLDVASEENSSETCRAAIVDISVGGCAFESNKEFESNSRVIIRFTLPNKKIYIIAGEVKRVRTRTGGTLVHGVQFDKAGFFEKLKRKKLIKKIR